MDGETRTLHEGAGLFGGERGVDRVCKESRLAASGRARRVRRLEGQKSARIGETRLLDRHSRGHLLLEHVHLLDSSPTIRRILAQVRLYEASHIVGWLLERVGMPTTCRRVQHKLRVRRFG